MIPKIIHYCWFGNSKKPKKVLKIIDSWKKKLPDYSFKEWNESNFDVNSNLFTKEAYSAKKYAFVSDFVRLYALYEFGGIYLDTDVEILKKFDNYLVFNCFVSSESKKSLCTAVIGAEKGSEIIHEFLKLYVNKTFYVDNKADCKPNSEILFEFLSSKYLLPEIDINKQYSLDKIIIFPISFFCAKDFKTYDLLVDSNTIAIHHLDASWYNPLKKILRFVKKVLIKIGFKEIWRNK